MKNGMTNEDIAQQVNEIREVLDPLLRDLMRKGKIHMALALALATAAAHHVLHDAGDEDDFAALARAAWTRSKEAHGNCPKTAD